MSPSGLVRNVPYTVTSRGGPVEEDSDEHEGTSAGRGNGAGEEQDAAVDRCGKDTVLSYRQTKRLWKRYRGEGAKGLQHRSAGKGSNRAKPEEFRRKVVQLIRKKYSGTEQERFGPTLAAEHLADEDGLEVGEETLRRWMLAEGLWSRMRRRKAHRKRRARREHFGDLVQLDGSFHAWFEERGASRLPDEHGG